MKGIERIDEFMKKIEFMKPIVKLVSNGGFLFNSMVYQPHGVLWLTDIGSWDSC